MTNNRPTAVTVIAVLNAIGGVLSILGGLAALLLGGLAGLGGTAQGDANVAGAGIVASILGIVIIILGGLSLVVAYGLWTLQAWAWITAVVLQGIGILFNLVTLIQGNAGVIFSLVISGVILYYLFRPNVRQAFGRV